MTTWTIDQMDKNMNILDSDDVEIPDHHRNAWQVMQHLVLSVDQQPFHPECVAVSIRRWDVE